MSESTNPGRAELDLSDVDPRVGQLVGGGQLWEPCSATDIRRWVHAMDYPNPIHWNQEFARSSKFGGIVAPRSLTYFEVRVAAKTEESAFGMPTVALETKLANQDGAVLVNATLGVELPY
jgi:hypothetical protein